MSEVCYAHWHFWLMALVYVTHILCRGIATRDTPTKKVAMWLVCRSSWTSRTSRMPALVLLVSSIVLPSASAQTFTPTGSLNVARAGHQATLLADGHVLVTGGYDASGNAIAQAELFDPGSGTWTVTGRNVFARLEHTATLLQDGRVLVAGGVGNLSACTFAGTAELYDPLTGLWSVTNSALAPAGSGPVAVRLLDGRVLVSGGGNRCG